MEESVLLLERSSSIKPIAEEDTTLKSPCPVASSNSRPVDKEVVKSTDTSTVNSRAEPCSDESLKSVSVLRNLSMFSAEEYVDVDAKVDVEKSVGDACSKCLDNIVLANDVKKPVQKEIFSQSNDGENNVKDIGDVNCNAVDTRKPTTVMSYSNVHSFDKLGDSPEKDTSCYREMKISKTETLKTDPAARESQTEDQIWTTNAHTEENKVASVAVEPSHQSSDSLQFKKEYKRLSEGELRHPVTDSPVEQRTGSYSSMFASKTNAELSLKEVKSLKKQKGILGENCALNGSKKFKEDTTLAEGENVSENNTDDSDLCERVKRRHRTKTKVLQVGENRILSPKTSISPDLETKEATKPLAEELSDSQSVFSFINDNAKISDETVEDKKHENSDVQRYFNEVAVKKSSHCRVREKLFSDLSSSNSSSQRSVEEIIPASIPSLKGSPDMVIDPMIPHVAGNNSNVVIPTSSMQSIKRMSQESPIQMRKPPCTNGIVLQNHAQLVPVIDENATVAWSSCIVDGCLEDTFKNKIVENQVSCQNEVESLESIPSCTSEVLENVISLASKTPDTEDDDQTLDSYTSRDTPVPSFKDQPTTPCLFGGESLAFTSSESTSDQRSSKKLSLRTKRNKRTREIVSKSSESSCDEENSFTRSSFTSSVESKSNDRLEDNSTCQSISVLQDLDDTVLEQNVACIQKGKSLNDKTEETFNVQTTSDEEPSPKRTKWNNEHTAEPEKEHNCHQLRGDESAVQEEINENRNFANSLESHNSSHARPKSSRGSPRAQSKFQSIPSYETEDEYLNNSKGTKRTFSQDPMIGCEFKFARPLPCSSYGVDDAFSQDDIIPPTPPVSKHGVNTAQHIPQNKLIPVIVPRDTPPSSASTSLQHATGTEQGQTSSTDIAKRKIHEENNDSPTLKRVCEIKENSEKEEDTVGKVQDAKIDYENVFQDAEYCKTDERTTMEHQDDVSAEHDDDWQDSPTDKLLLEPTFVHDLKSNEQPERNLPENERVNHSHHENDRHDLFVSGETYSQEAHEIGEEDPLLMPCKFLCNVDLF